MIELKKETLQIETLHNDQLMELLALCRNSNLPTLSDGSKLASILAHPRERVFGAYINNELVGCSCLIFNEQKTYIRDNAVRTFPTHNICLCGTYVNPTYRGAGIGNRLYASRLAVALELKILPLIVELMGDGTRGSVHPETIPGYNFHLNNGFEELGYSTDHDAGKILIYPKQKK